MGRPVEVPSDALKRVGWQWPEAIIARDHRAISDVETTQPANGDALSTGTATPPPTAMQRADPRHNTRVKISMHHLNNNLENKKSNTHILTTKNFPIYTPPNSNQT